LLDIIEERFPKKGSMCYLKPYRKGKEISFKYSAPYFGSPMV